MERWRNFKIVVILQPLFHLRTFDVHRRWFWAEPSSTTTATGLLGAQWKSVNGNQYLLSSFRPELSEVRIETAFQLPAVHPEALLSAPRSASKRFTAVCGGNNEQSPYDHSSSEFPLEATPKTRVHLPWIRPIYSLP